MEFPTYLGAHYDASTTNLTYRIDTPKDFSPLEITVSFLSPITPTSTLRQAIPASYVTVHVHGDVNVNIYMDVNGRWVSGDPASRLVWQLENPRSSGTASESSVRTWQFRRENELHLSEIRDRAEWGTLHFTGPAVSPTCISALDTFGLALTDLRMPGSSRERRPQ